MGQRIKHGLKVILKENHAKCFDFPADKFAFEFAFAFEFVRRKNKSKTTLNAAPHIPCEC